ncbi:isopeptide-forming domain-containing fimbrial protein [Candidatus Enterococcus mansonii]|uniref:DUF11 domain-containing protein n=1 Tax=Candidatus Enterococcus mansonii TaxID=1834181 RepID=A0A242CD13_9ENTE|nr:isopeptide-forming domain-containing fimbrial protein [Enterococcus sp. 4G2_DIV0659]OTO08154.1 hypothetical protein A5880_002424 [Enterococcus sp. 4G2_DIV0659]
MQFRTKMYFMGIVILMLSLLMPIFFNGSKKIKASNENYKIEISYSAKGSAMTATLTVTDPVDEELYFSYEGIESISNEQIQEGVASDYNGKIKVSKRDGAHENILKIKKDSKPLVITFPVKPRNGQKSGYLKLLNSANQELTYQKLQFERADTKIKDSEKDTESIEEQVVDENQVASKAIKPRAENIVSVGTWPTFLAAWNNPAVTKIKMTSDITRSGSARVEARTTDIEIDGSKEIPGVGQSRYYKLDLTSTSLPLGKIGSGTALLHVHDLVVQNRSDDGAPSSHGNTAAVFGDQYYDPNNTQVATNRWNLRFGNVIVPRGTTSRLARVPRGKVTVYGDMNLHTRSENFYLGAMYVEDDTTYYGAITNSNYSTIWFRQASIEGDTGDNKFVVGKNSDVKLRNVGNGTTFPAIYRYYKEIIINEGAKFSATVPGNAVGFGGVNQKFIAKKGAVVTLTSKNSNSSVATVGPTLASGNGPADSGFGDNGTANDVLFHIEPGASFYSIGRAGATGMINWSRGTGNKFIMDTPEKYDIRNNESNVAVNVAGTGNTFEIRNSEVSLWKNTTNVSSVADYSHDNITNFSILNRTTASSLPTDLATDFNSNQGNFRRILGLNTDPSIEMKPLTDADKTITNYFRVKLGEVPDDSGIAEDGSINFIPVYAKKDQATVTINYQGELQNVLTNSEGYANYVIPEFYKAGEKITVKAKRSGLESSLQETEPVIDITPPEPAKLTEGRVTTHTKQLKGTKAEPNAKIYVDINGVRQATVGRVKEDGQWMYDLPRYLNAGEVVEIFLEDNAGKITETLNPAVPSTNSENGNINPSKTMKYRDAEFKAPEKYTVVDTLPDNPQMTKEVVSSGNTTTQVGDTLTYTLTAKNGKSDTLLEAVWKNVEIVDVIPDGLIFELEKNPVMINDRAAVAEEHSYDPNTRKLKVKVGDLGAGESVKVTFTAKVDRSAVGIIIKNTAEATGHSLRESGTFNPGPPDPDRPLENYSKSASVENPGGKVLGTLDLISAPKEIDFGENIFNGKTIRIDNPLYRGGELIVSDSREVRKNWTLTAKLDQEMRHTANKDLVLKNAVRYVTNKNEFVLNRTDSIDVLVHKNVTDSDYNVTNTWTPNGDGLKLEVSASDVKQTGSYKGVILWQLGDTK